MIFVFLKDSYSTGISFDKPSDEFSWICIKIGDTLW
ncbi:spiroplasma phage ORF1-like family protein [Spiroplasma poulsonii]